MIIIPVLIIKTSYIHFLMLKHATVFTLSVCIAYYRPA